MNPRPRKRTRRFGAARRGRMLTARLVTRDSALTLFTASRTVIVNGRSPRGWCGASMSTLKNPTASVGAAATGTPSTSTSTAEDGAKSVPDRSTSSRASADGPVEA